MVMTVLSPFASCASRAIYQVRLSAESAHMQCNEEMSATGQKRTYPKAECLLTPAIEMAIRHSEERAP